MSLRSTLNVLNLNMINHKHIHPCLNLNPKGKVNTLKMLQTLVIVTQHICFIFIKQPDLQGMQCCNYNGFTLPSNSIENRMTEVKTPLKKKLSFGNLCFKFTLKCNLRTYMSQTLVINSQRIFF